MHPFAVRDRLRARCRWGRELQEVQAGGLLRTALWQPIPLLELLHPALALWEKQLGNLKDQLNPGVCLDRQEADDFRTSTNNDGANGDGGGIHLNRGG